MINWKIREQTKHNLETDKRHLKVLEKRLNILISKAAPNDVKAIQTSLFEASGIKITDLELLREIDNLAFEIGEYKGIIDEEKKNIQYMRDWLENYIDITNDIEAIIYKEYKQYDGKKTLKEISFETKYSYDYCKNVSSRIKQAIER